MLEQGQEEDTTNFARDSIGCTREIHEVSDPFLKVPEVSTSK